MRSLVPTAGPLRVLAVGAHPDDIEIGCGATLLHLAGRAGTTLDGVVLTGSVDRVAEATGALAAFFPGAALQAHSFPDGRLPAHWDEVKDTLHELAGRLSPDVILCPKDDDAHQDHRLLGQLVPTVWRDTLILHYEIPKWDADLRPPTHYVMVPSEVARRKVRLLNDHYLSQRDREWWDDELFLGLMRLRGIECRAPYAEGFFASKVVVELR